MGHIEARYARIAANAPGMFYQFVLRPDGSVGFSYVSEGSRELYGLETQDIHRDAALVIDMIHPEDRPGFDRSVEASAAALSPWKWEGRFTLRSGEQKWLRGASRPERQPNGDILWDGLLMDVTEHKRTEEALGESERRLRAVLVQYGSDIIMILEAGGAIRYQSPAVERALGYRADELIGKSVLDYVHPEDAERASGGFGGILKDPGLHGPVEYRFRRKDGSWRHLEGIGNNLLDDPSVEGIVINSRDVTERKAFERRLKHQAFHDALTGLPNRVLFEDRLQRTLASEGEPGAKVAVLFVDLDDFKVVNDSLGHRAGDRLLAAAARRLRGCLRPQDTVARFGGDEFAVLLDDAWDDDGARRVAERMVEELQRAPFDLEGTEVFIAPSVGIALGTVGEDRYDDLMRRADVAMYEAKKGGGAHYALYAPGMDLRALERLNLRSDLRRAMERGEFVVHYQPVVLLQTGRVVGMEALVRWEHPEHGVVLPGEFVPLAEETGLIVPIGLWVLREACRRAKEWQGLVPGDPPLVMCVNLSARQLGDPQLVPDVVRILQETGLGPRHLTLEITESALVDDGVLREGALERLRGLGVRLAVDDFGTGYSSLSYLRRLPADMLKIDGSFVEGIEGGAKDEVLLSGVIGIAHGLSMLVVAEGVESAGQARRLEALGCDLAQGFYFARPLPSEAAGRLLAQERSGLDKHR